MPSKKGPARIFKLPRLLDHCPDPIAIVSDQFEVVYANQSCCNWLDVSNENLVGQVISYTSATDENRFNGICPSPQLFTGELESRSGQVHVIRDGNRIFRNAMFCPMHTEDERRLAVLVIATGDDGVIPPNESPVDHDWHEMLARIRRTESEIFNTASLVGISDAAIRIRRQVSAAADNQADCLVIGPAGSGREHVARTIFAERNIPNAQLVPIHCSIADSELIQSAIKNWVFDRRSNDSSDWLLLLDVDQLTVDAQSELLGYTRIPDFQMPIIATSRNDLVQLASNERFSTSLAMYLSIQIIELSPISQRMQDLPMLVQSIIERNNRHSTNQVAAVSDEAMSTLSRYHWPRNVAQLKQYLDAAHQSCKGATIGVNDLPSDFSHALSAARIGNFQLQEINLTDFLEDVERELITRALTQCGNNKAKAGRLLGISRARLLRRSKSLGVSPGQQENDQLIDESEFKEAD